MNFALNLVDIVILGLLLLSLVAGMYKGFISSGLTTVGFVAAFFGAQSFYPQLSTAIQSNTSLMNVLGYYLDASSMFTTKQLGDVVVSGAAQSGQLAQAVSDLKAIKMPDAIVTAFQSNVTKEVFSNMGFNTFTQYLNQTIWSAAMDVASFLLMFFVSYLLVVLIVSLLNNVFHFPLLRHFDWLLGGAFGLVRGAVIVALVLAVIPMAMSLVKIDVVEKLINDSVIASYFPKDFAIADIIVKAFR